jgi:MFS family permease
LGKAYGPRYTTLLGAGVIVFCTICLIFVTNKYLFLFLYSSLFGVSTINFMPPVICCWRHFPTIRGRISGIVLAGFALAPLIFNFIVKYIVNPDNLSPTIAVHREELTDYYYAPEVGNNVPKLFVVLLVIWSVMLVFIYYLLVDPQTTNGPVDNSFENESIQESFLLSRMNENKE